MPIYIVVPLSPDHSALDSAVQQRIELQTDRYKLQSNRGWLIKFDGTTVELSNHLGLTGQDKGEPAPLGSGIVVPVSGYYGRGPTDMWEWLKTRLEE